MPVRIYDLAKKLGLESKAVLAKAKELGITTAKVVSRVLAALQPGEIVLMHLGANPTDHTTLDAAALPTIIDRIRAQGYTFVTVQSLTG